MNNQLIQTIIESNGEVWCPEASYKNPLLDKNVAKSLSKSFVKILNVSQQNSNVNNKLRTSILENIRKLCNGEHVGHMPADECLREALNKLYLEQLRSAFPNSAEKDLEAFLVRKYKALNISSQYDSSLNQDIVRALINLNDNGIYLEILSKEIVHWDNNKGNYLSLIKSFWNIDDDEQHAPQANMVHDDIAIKMKPEIEKTLLNICYEILTVRDLNLESICTSNNSLLQLVKKCSVSCECFQICCNVFNFMFIMTNFDSQLQTFIPIFVRQVKLHCPQITFSVLYPVHLSHIIVLLDFDINELPEPLRSNYITPTFNYLVKLRESSEYDFILLLSHFPQWFDIYFKS